MSYQHELQIKFPGMKVCRYCGFEVSISKDWPRLDDIWYHSDPYYEFSPPCNSSLRNKNDIITN